MKIKTLLTNQSQLTNFFPDWFGITPGHQNGSKALTKLGPGELSDTFFIYNPLAIFLFLQHSQVLLSILPTALSILHHPYDHKNTDSKPVHFFTFAFYNTFSNGY